VSQLLVWGQTRGMQEEGKQLGEWSRLQEATTEGQVAAWQVTHSDLAPRHASSLLSSRLVSTRRNNNTSKSLRRAEDDTKHRLRHL
jgi:hypothetical protein